MATAGIVNTLLLESRGPPRANAPKSPAHAPQAPCFKPRAIVTCSQNHDVCAQQ